MVVIIKSASDYSKAAISAGALFILGDAVISSPPKGYQAFSVWGYLTAISIGVLLYLAVIPIANFINTQKQGDLRKIIKTALLAVLSVASAFVGAKAFALFTDFVGEVMLPQSSQWFINICLAAVVLFFSFKSQEASLKFSLLCFVFVLIAIIIFFFGSITDFDIKNLEYESKNIQNKALPYFLNPVLPSLLLPFYYKAVLKNQKTMGHISVIIGYILLGVCILSAVLLFGAELSARLSFPYSSAVSTITVGRLYTRLDGFSYFIYFATSVSKINISVFLCRYSLQTLGGMYQSKNPSLS